MSSGNEAERGTIQPRLHSIECRGMCSGNEAERVTNERNIFCGIAKLLIMGIRTHLNTDSPDSAQKYVVQQ